AVVEHYGAPEKQMWTIGEEIRVGALRSMSSPKLFKNPDCYTGTYWTNVVGCSPNNGNDQCGVHNNSGVLNHWFYLLVEGGKGTNDLSNNFEVAGIGVKSAASLVFLTEQALSATATYADCRSTSIGAASTLFGSCSREVEAVTRAWYAVGVGSAFSPCAPQIGFAIADTTVNKVVPGIICPSSKTISIPLRITGNAPTGGNASVTVAGTGTAIDGVDFKIVNSPLTFNSGSSASQNIQVSIIDNGDVTKDKVLKLYFTITKNGSNASTSYTYDTCVITITGERDEPDTNGNVHHRVNTANVKSKAITPFFSRNKLARSQFIITADEMLAAGVRPNEQITALEFNVTEKNSTQAFNNFNLKLATTTVSDVSAGNPTVTTVYYNGNLTTQAGWNTLQFSTPFIWNGTDNLAIETCFSNLTAGTENDFIEGIVTDYPATSIAHSNSGTDGCTLAFSSGNYYYSIAKPVIRLVQPTFATQVETIKVAGRPWEVSPNQSVYFTNDTSGKLIVNISKPQLLLGCTTVGITAQGNGLDTVVGNNYKGVKRSVKEFSVSTQNNTTSAMPNYEMTLYFDTSELSGVNLANMRIVSTDATTDAMMNGANTEIVVPVITNGPNYISFKGSFKGNNNGMWKGIWGRYFITENTFNLLPWESVEGISKNTGNIRVVNNPFTDKIYISYTLSANTVARVKLYDITGKTLLDKEEQLAAGSSRFVVNVGDTQLVPGNYILQVITGSEVLTQKMVKQ
ncbi:MAG: M4 family metallopeptidase, partial [Chitinophagaceae bacterium]|nr:M4 family metallopeptidase [Chitinophagaceae bacterium]